MIIVVKAIAMFATAQKKKHHERQQHTITPTPCPLPLCCTKTTLKIKDERRKIYKPNANWLEQRKWFTNTSFASCVYFPSSIHLIQGNRLVGWLLLYFYFFAVVNAQYGHNLLINAHRIGMCSNGLQIAWCNLNGGGCQITRRYGIGTVVFSVTHFWERQINEWTKWKANDSIFPLYQHTTITTTSTRSRWGEKIIAPKTNAINSFYDNEWCFEKRVICPSRDEDNEIEYCCCF